MKVLFSVDNLSYVRLFESVLAGLAARGHQVSFVAEGGAHLPQAPVWESAAAELTTAHPSIAWRYAPERPFRAWDGLSSRLRFGADYLRYFKADFAGAPVLKRRAESRAPAGVRRLMSTVPVGRSAVAASGARLLAAMDTAIPVHDGVARLIDDEAPDVVMVSPLIGLGSPQLDLLREADRRGIPSVLAVGSWDHLSSKAVIRGRPDVTLVWNETQREEARRWHGLRGDEVVVTGAQCFDQWFDRHPSTRREAFAGGVGLDPSLPYILYVCTALFDGSPAEAPFVAEWITSLRTSDDLMLRRAGVLIRPHPKRAAEWTDVDLSMWENVVVWPRHGDAPFGDEGKAAYFDSMHHSAAVVGLNTSAMIESAVVGRPVLTVMLPQFRDNQEGTLHFRYLLDGGLLEPARTFDEHLRQLAATLRDPAGGERRSQAFVGSFVRPVGRGRSATDVFVASVERVAAAVRTPRTAAWWHAPLRAVLAPVAARMPEPDWRLRERRYAEEEQHREARLAADRLRKDQRRRDKEADRARREADLEIARQEQKLRARRAALAAKLTHVSAELQAIDDELARLRGERIPGAQTPRKIVARGRSAP